MDESLNEIFKTIDNFDANENIKGFYKEILFLESNNSVYNYKKEYDKLIGKFLEDY